VHFLKKASMGTEADLSAPSWKPEAGFVPVGTLGNSEEPSPGGPPAAEVRKVPSVLTKQPVWLEQSEEETECYEMKAERQMGPSHVSSVQSLSRV